MKLASVFTDHAVLQRNMYVPVWGKEATPGTMISASINGYSSCGKVARDGRFFLRLPPMPAGGPYELTVSNDETGESITLQDILIGEVWVASGQSNMAYTLASDWRQLSENPEKLSPCVGRSQLKEFCETVPTNGLIRAITVPLCAEATVETEFSASWQVIDGQTARTYTAIGMWFAKNLQEKLNIPVGIVSCSFGGSPAEAWMSRAGLLSNPDTAHLPGLMDERYLKVENWTRQNPESFGFTFKDPGNEGFGKGWADPDFDCRGWKTMDIPGSWIQQKIAQNGAIWVRTYMDIPESWAGKDVTLHLGPIDKHDITYFNGVEVGRTGKNFEEQFWCVFRTYTIPGNLVKAGTGTLAIRAFSFAYNGALSGTPEDFYLACGEEKIFLAGKWAVKVEVDLGLADADYHVFGAGNHQTPSILMDCMLRGIIPYGMKGVIWYQGESNHEVAPAYRNTMAALIRDWRYLWGQGDFPFIQVELAGFRDLRKYAPGDKWPTIRNGQRQVCGDLPQVYLASAIDLGESYDIHPQNKKDVGYRMAQVAFHEVYALADTVPCGPMYKGCKREGKWLRLFFDNAKGLYFKGGKAQGFYAVKSAEEFAPVDEAVIEDGTVRVRCDALGEVFNVCYSWADFPDGNLYNGADLPASTFSTDYRG